MHIWASAHFCSCPKSFHARQIPKIDANFRAQDNARILYRVFVGLRAIKIA